MTTYNREFHLTLDDVQIIEECLHDRIAHLSKGDCDEKCQAKIERIRELLGSIHNQKIWYRPSTGVYVGG